MADNRSDTDKAQAHSGQLVAFLVGGVLFGFVVALYLGAFSGKDYEKLSDWFSVLIAAIAAGISAYAVFLVAKTLEATRETLKATSEMVEDQKKANKEQAKIGLAQTRPWVLIDSLNFNDPINPTFVNVRLRNFGFNPALRVKAITQILVSKNESANKVDDEASLDGQRYWNGIGALPCGVDFIAKSDVFSSMDLMAGNGLMLCIELSYSRPGYWEQFKFVNYYSLNYSDGNFQITDISIF